MRTTKPLLRSCRDDRNCSNRNEAGFFTLWVLGLCVCLLFIGGISIDLWRVLQERSNLAAIADAATLSAASQIDLDAFKATPSVLQLDPIVAKKKAVSYIAQATADQHIHLVDEEVTADNGSVQIRLARDIDSSLIRLLRPGTTYTVSVTSAAEPKVDS